MLEPEMKNSLSIPSRAEVIQEHKEKEGQVAAILPYHYPRPIFTAFDILPVEVWGPPRVDTSLGSAHLQPYICSLVRNALSFLLAGDLQETDFILVPHGCDSLQGLGSILMDFIHTRQRVFPFYIPRREEINALDFLAAETRSLFNKIKAATGIAPEEDKIQGSVRQHQEADELLTRLHASRQNIKVSQIELYRLLRSREYLPAPVFSELARGVLSTSKRKTQNDGIPILLSGIVPEPMEILEGLSELGAFVVADDLACCGRRLYPPSSSDDVFTAMAESILAAPPDSTRGSSVEGRIQHLKGLAESSGAKGVIFLEIKFCEPELFYLPLLCQALKKAGLPSLVLEVELNDPFTHQLRTRIEAFLEMIA